MLRFSFDILASFLWVPFLKKFSVKSAGGSLLALVGLARVERVDRPCRVDERSARVDHDRDAERVGDLVGRRAVLSRELDVRRDTAVTSHRDRNGERDQLPRLRVERARRRARGDQRAIPLHQIRRRLGDLPDRRGQLLPVRVPVEHAHGSPLSCCPWRLVARTGRGALPSIDLCLEHSVIEALFDRSCVSRKPRSRALSTMGNKIGVVGKTFNFRFGENAIYQLHFVDVTWVEHEAVAIVFIRDRPPGDPTNTAWRGIE